MKEDSENRTLDIHSKGDYPSCALSNFAVHPFVLDGVRCQSMEGFLQSLKFRNPQKQKQVCLLSGKAAKNAAKHTFSGFRWKITGKLYWQGRAYKRLSDEYQVLLDRAYSELFKNEEFCAALKSTGGSALCHSIGCKDKRKTVLTEYEFISRLERLRKQ